MSYYYYEKPRQSSKTWVKIMAIVMLAAILGTAIAVSRMDSNRIAGLEKTIEAMETKEVYYKDIERQFFERKADGIVDERYEQQLNQKDVEKEEAIAVREAKIDDLNDYIGELSDQTAALENTVRKVASTSSVKPRNYVLPTTISRGSYERYKSLDKLEYVGVWTMTAYAPTKEECGSNKGLTSSGKPVQPGQNIAIDPRYWKYGQKFYIEGYGEVVATDKGSAIKGRNRLDYCVLDPALAAKFGSKKVKVWLIK